MTNTENHPVRKAFTGFLTGATIASALIYGIPALTTTAPVAPTATHTATAPAVWDDGVAACQVADGTTLGQSFPCRWDQDGAVYTLAEPAGPGSGYELPTGAPTPEPTR